VAGGVIPIVKISPENRLLRRGSARQRPARFHSYWQTNQPTFVNKRSSRILSTFCPATIQGLKAILDSLSRIGGVAAKEWKARFLRGISNPAWLSNGLTKQIHVQDCYSRLGTARHQGRSAVSRCPDAKFLPTLVNFDSTVTATPKSAGFSTNADRVEDAVEGREIRLPDFGATRMPLPAHQATSPHTRPGFKCSPRPEWFPCLCPSRDPC